MSHEIKREPFRYVPVGTPSPHGSAEVIARGFNSYTDKWSSLRRPEDYTGSASMLTHWDKFHLFPTVVRVGNFVFCIGGPKTGTSHAVGHWDDVLGYILIDIVPDPEDPDRLGRNVAYPYIFNGNGGHSITGVLKPRTEEQMLGYGYDTLQEAYDGQSTQSTRIGYEGITETVDDTNFVLNIIPHSPTWDNNAGSGRPTSGWGGHWVGDGWRPDGTTGYYPDGSTHTSGSGDHPYPRLDEYDQEPGYGGFGHTTGATVGSYAKAILSFNTEGSVTGARVGLTDADLQTDTSQYGYLGWETRMYGWGGPLYVRKLDGTYHNYDERYESHYWTNKVVSVQHLFAPVSNYKQFKTLYGNEWDWGRPARGGHHGYKWLFEVPSQAEVPQAYQGFGAHHYSSEPSYLVMYPNRNWTGPAGTYQRARGLGEGNEDWIEGGEGEVAEIPMPHYPFTIQTPDSNESALPPEEVVHEYDAVDIPTFTDLAGGGKAVLGGVAVCNKDLIGKMADSAGAELKNMASSVMAAGSTALQGLQEKAGQVKDTLVANLPPIPEKITNLYDAITNLDLGDLKAVELFKDKYGDLVPSITDLLSNFKKPDFDICSILSISHENSINPENPTTAPVEPARNNAVPQVGASQPVANDSGLTKENAEAANRTIDQAWKRVEVKSLLTALAKPETAADESNAPKGWVPVMKDGKVVGHKKPPKGGVPVIEGGKVVGHRKPAALGAGENPIISDDDADVSKEISPETKPSAYDQYHSADDLDGREPSRWAQARAWRRGGGTASGWRAKQEGRKIESGDES